MAKRNSGSAPQKDSATPTPNPPGTTTAGGLEQRVVAFAEQLGRVVGTFQKSAESWMDREALNKQITAVRDGAADLLEQLAASATKVSAAAAPPAATGKRKTAGRSGGVVDAPGKKHRKPMPADPGGKIADSQAAKMRTAKPMVKTIKRRGRG